MRLSVCLAPTQDHFDAENLRAHVNKDAVVLLPDFPVPDLRNELQKLDFIGSSKPPTRSNTAWGPNGDLDVMIIALRAPPTVRSATRR